MVEVYSIMDLQQMIYFKTIARLESVTKAAAELHISQPSLSVAIRKLETELGVKLFDRVSGHIRLNALGRSFLQHCDRIFRDIEEAKLEISDLAGHISNSVRFSCTSNNLCCGLLERFMKTNPDYNFSQFIHSVVHVREQLEDNLIDFVISTEEINHPDIVWTPIRNDRLVLVVGRQHPLSTRSSVKVEALEKERFVVLRSAFHPTEGEYADFISGAKISPENCLITNEFEAMLSMVSMGLGVAVVSEISARQLLATAGTREYFILQTHPLITRPIGLAYLKGHYFTQAVRKFYDFTADYFRNLPF